MTERLLRLGIDPRPAEQGAREWERAVERIEVSSKRLGASLEEGARREVNIYRRAAEERIQLERDLATRRSASAQVDAVAAAESFVRAQESYYRSNVARIKEAQARGLMSPAEAREAGQRAALEFNNAVLGALDRRPQFAQNRQAFTTLAGSIKNIDEAGRSAGVGMHRLNNSLIVLARQATGTHPVVGQLVDVVGTFAIGTAKMVPILGGIAAIAGGFRIMSRDARESKKELEENLEVLQRIATQQSIEDRGGSARIAVQAAQEEARRIAVLLRQAQDPDVGNQALVESYTEQLREVNDKIRAGLRDIEETESESRDRRLKDEEAFQMRMDRLMARLPDALEPRTLSGIDFLTTGHRQITGPAPFRGRGTFVGQEMGGVDRSVQAREDLADATETFALRMGDANDALIDFGRIGDSLGERFNLTNILEGAAGNLISGGISMAAGMLGDALFGDRYETLLMENTRALKELTGRLELDIDAIPSESLRDQLHDMERRQRFGADISLTRRELDASDATPEEQFRAIQQALSRNVGGAFGQFLQTVTTDNIDEVLQATLASIRAGTFDADLLGDVSVEQLLDTLAELESLADSTEGVREEFDALTRSIQALNSPQGLNLALLAYRAAGGGDVGGGGGVPGGPNIGPTGGPSGGGGGGRTGGDVIFNINGSQSPRETAAMVMREIERVASLGGPDPLRLARR